ncbi:hypothetical protein AAVH_04701 [Aphelenchoides avenae]|nr:hypothetical protein AAVH_04701 [Aphelenchus avenae]
MDAQSGSLPHRVNLPAHLGLGDELQHLQESVNSLLRLLKTVTTAPMPLTRAKVRL